MRGAHDARMHPSGSCRIAALRQLLADRFPVDTRRVGAVMPTGVPALDEALGGGLAPGALTEIVSTGPSTGGQLVQLSLLHAAAVLARRAVLVDGADAFDPQSAGGESRLGGIIWVRCSSVADAMQVTDLLVRDANLGLVILDLRGCPLAALRRTHATAWYRLQRAAEGTAAPVVVQTPQPLVPSATCRVALTGRFNLASCNRPRTALLAEVGIELIRSRWSGGFDRLTVGGFGEAVG